VAWIASAPLVAHYFHLFSPFTVLANVLVVPLGSLALISNFIGLATAPVSDFATACFNHSAWLFMEWMVKTSEWVAQLPGGSMYVPSPGATGLIFLYSTLLALGFLMTKKVTLKWLIPVPLVSGFCWAILGTVSLMTTNLLVISTSNAQVIYFDAPGKRSDLLIDCGDSFAYEKQVRPLLRARGVNSLATFVATHGDVRHMGAWEQVLTNLSPKQVVFSKTVQRSPGYRELTMWASRERVREVQAGDQLGKWRVCHPAGDFKSSRGKDSVLVLQGNFGSGEILLLSALSRAGQNLLLNRRPDLQADYLFMEAENKNEQPSEALMAHFSKSQLILTTAFHPTRKTRPHPHESAIAGANQTVQYFEPGKIFEICNGPFGSKQIDHGERILNEP
jgi:competence protein ComEC